MPLSTSVYTQTAALEPLLPSGSAEELARLSNAIFHAAGALSSKLTASSVRARAARLVSKINSYYSNLIEGHKTLPRDIERALHSEFSSSPEQRHNQFLSRAHIEVERLMIERVQREPELSIYSSDFLCWLHKEFFDRLPPELRTGKDHAGLEYSVEPGALRNFEVTVGRLQPPASRFLPAFLSRFEQGYNHPAIPPTAQLVSVAASHHRLAWIHPFGDGNGRIARLFSHACLLRAGVGAFGLWTLSRGLARQRQRYFAALAEADQPRRSDLDGRGNLSDRGLAQFCVFFLQTMLDQIEFMTSLFDFENLAARIERFLHFERPQLALRDRERLFRLLKAALVEGEVERGQVSAIVGLGATAARKLIRLALAERLLESPSEKGPLTLSFSSATLESYFPKLYQDLPASS